MDRRQKLILLFSVLVFLGAMFGAAYLSNLGEGPALDTSQRFVAKPGTTRENAVALSSNKRASTESSTAISAPSPNKKELPVRSLSGTEEFVPEVTSDLANQALNVAAPAQGIALLNAALAENPEGNALAVLEGARGVLLSRLDEEQWPEAQSAFDRAIAAAEDEAVRTQVLEQYVQALIRRDALDEAESFLNQELAAAASGTESALRLRVLSGTVLELKGQSVGATEAYEMVVEDLLRQSETWDARGADLARLASLRLARLYREAGEDQAARRLARRVQARLTPDTMLP